MISQVSLTSVSPNIVSFILSISMQSHVKAKFMISCVSPTTVPLFQLEHFSAPCPQNLKAETKGFTMWWQWNNMMDGYGMDLQVG